MTGVTWTATVLTP